VDFIQWIFMRCVICFIRKILIVTIFNISIVYRKEFPKIIVIIRLKNTHFGVETKYITIDYL